MPTPSAAPTAPLPASVLTTPPGVTRRTQLLPESPTIALPLASTAMPWGSLKEALAPAPLANAAAPLPASVDTTPAGVTRRMRWL